MVANGPAARSGRKKTKPGLARKEKKLAAAAAAAAGIARITEDELCAHLVKKLRNFHACGGLKGVRRAQVHLKRPLSRVPSAGVGRMRGVR